MNVIDVHNHVNPRPYLKAMRAGRDWYGFTADHGELENPRNHWTLEQRIADMDRLGVDMQALTVYRTWRHRWLSSSGRSPDLV
jgi:hypothetical protein